MKKSFWLGVLLGLFGLWQVTPSFALSLGFVPPAQTVPLGTSVAVDVVISGLEDAGMDEIVSAYDLDIIFDESIIAPTGLIFGSSLTISLQAFDLFLAPGVIDVAEVSLEDDATLATQQGDSITLFTLLFDTVRAGTTPLEIILNDFNDVKGRDAEILPLDPSSGVITVTSSAVPEPGTFVLLGTGFLGLLGYTLRKRRQSVA